MTPRIVFDIDDTICKDGKRLGYENAIPMQATIDKINYLHDHLGARIILYTARGMGSCNGDGGKAKAKNEATLIEWLDRHQVAYDEIIFGKPLADLYVDEKGMSLDDFISKDFRELKGGSGAKIYQLGDIVVKQMSSIEEVEKVKEWAENTALRHPRILGNVYENLYMEYVEGRLACDCLDGSSFEDIINDISNEAKRHINKFATWRLLEVLDANKGRDERIDRLIEICKDKLCKLDEFFQKNASASHGDMTLCNIIVKGWTNYYIDPRPDQEASSYLLDYAKLRMSIDGYERIFKIGNGIDLRWWLKRLDGVLADKGILEAVKTLEFMYILRLTRYGKDPDLITKFAEGVLAEID